MDRLEALIYELRSFVAEREWEQFHDPKNLVMALASEAGELLAEYRWVSNAESDAYSRADARRDRISEEAADIGIALLLFCDRVGIDLVAAIKDKTAINRRNYPVERSRGKASRPE